MGTVTKKVRLGPERARRLRRLARARGVTESDVLREGLDLVERVRARPRNIEGLIRLIEGTEPSGIDFQLGPRESLCIGGLSLEGLVAPCILSLT